MLKDTRKHRLAGVLIWLFIFFGLGYQIPNRMLPVELTVTATEPGMLSVWVLDDSQVVWKNSGFVEEPSDDSAVPHLISSQELAQITIRLPRMNSRVMFSGGTGHAAAYLQFGFINQMIDFETTENGTIYSPRQLLAPYVMSYCALWVTGGLLWTLWRCRKERRRIALRVLACLAGLVWMELVVQTGLFVQLEQTVRPCEVTVTLQEGTDLSVTRRDSDKVLENEGFRFTWENGLTYTAQETGASITVQDPYKNRFLGLSSPMPSTVQLGFADDESRTVAVTERADADWTVFDYMQLPSWQTANRIAWQMVVLLLIGTAGIILSFAPSRHTAVGAVAASVSWFLFLIPLGVRLGFLNAWENLWYGPGDKEKLVAFGTAALGIAACQAALGYCRKYNEAVRARYQAFSADFRTYVPACRIDHRHWLIFGGLLLVFFAFQPQYYDDTVHYYANAQILEGNVPFSKWDIRRGPGFPFLIYLSSKLFGYTTLGSLVLMALFYLAAAVLLQKIFLLLDFPRCFGVWGSDAILCVLILLNPIIFGYYHTMLTEFAACTIVLAGFYLLLQTHLYLQSGCRTYRRWIYLLRIAAVAGLCVLGYATKQMFVLCVLVPAAASELILWIRRFSLRRVLVSVVSLMCVGTALLSYMSTWSMITGGGSAQKDGDYFYSSLSGAVRYIYPLPQQTSQEEDPEADELFVPNGDVEVGVYRRDGTLLRTQTLSCDGSVVGTLVFLKDMFFLSPSAFLASYWDNYLVLLNILQQNVQNMDYKHSPLSDQIYFVNGNEIDMVAEFYQNRQRGDTNLPKAPSKKSAPEGVRIFNEQIIQVGDASFLQSFLFNDATIGAADVAFSWGGFFAPVVMVFACIRMWMCARKKREDLDWTLIFLLSFSVFVYTLGIVVIASPVDRYLMPIYPLLLILEILLGHRFYLWLRQWVRIPSVLRTSREKTQKNEESL